MKTNKIIAALEGIGSVLDMAPNLNRPLFPNGRNPVKRVMEKYMAPGGNSRENIIAMTREDLTATMYGHFGRSGAYIQAAMEKVRDEQAQK